MDFFFSLQPKAENYRSPIRTTDDVRLNPAGDLPELPPRPGAGVGPPAGGSKGGRGIETGGGGGGGGGGAGGCTSADVGGASTRGGGWLEGGGVTGPEST